MSGERVIPSDNPASSSRTARSAANGPEGSGLVARFIAFNRRLCRAIDRRLPDRFSVDGNRHFAAVIVPKYLRPGMRVIDVGGGKTPFFSVETKNRLGLSVVGIDISADELARAPNGAYDVVVVADLSESRLEDVADLAVCMTVIEHVRSTERAVANLARLVRPGGVVALFVPCRNALFARLNLLLPEGFKQRLLRAVLPESAHIVGFPAYYDHCTPSELERIASAAGLRVVEQQVYHWSGYFDFFVPVYVCWRAVSLVAVWLIGPDACDRFCLVLVRPE